MIEKHFRIALLIGIAVITAIAATNITNFTSGLSLCQDQTDVDDIPCLGITPVLSCSGNISVVNLNTSAQSNLTTIAIGDGTYNFTFNFNRSSYSLRACDNSTSSIQVGDFEGDRLWKAAVLLGLIGIAALFGVMGTTIFESRMWMVKSFLYLSAFLVALIAVQVGFILSNSLVANIGRLMSISTISTIVCVGILFLYMMIFATVSIFRAVRDSRKERTEQL